MAATSVTCVSELPEQRGRFVILHTGLTLLVLVDQDVQGRVHAGPDVVLCHLDDEQRFADHILNCLVWPTKQGGWVKRVILAVTTLQNACRAQILLLQLRT
jgi:hypothetical protein